MKRNKCVIKSAIIELFAIGYFGVINTKSQVGKTWAICPATIKCAAKPIYHDQLLSVSIFIDAACYWIHLTNQSLLILNNPVPLYPLIWRQFLNFQ